MSDLVLMLSPEARERLQGLADKLGKSVEECLQLAVSEFLDHWEDYLQTIAILEDGEERPVLRVVND